VQRDGPHLLEGFKLNSLQSFANCSGTTLLEVGTQTLTVYDLEEVGRQKEVTPKDVISIGRGNYSFYLCDIDTLGLVD